MSRHLESLCKLGQITTKPAAAATGGWIPRAVLWIAVWLSGVVPAAAQPATKADSQIAAIVISFRRLCVDIFPSIGMFEEMGREFKWQRTPDLSTAVACVGSSGGAVDQVINPFQASDFGFPVNLSVMEVEDGNNKITSCAVGHPDASPEKVIAAMRKDIGLKPGGIYVDSNGGIQQTWAIGRFDKPFRISALYSKGPGVVLQICDDATGIVPIGK